MRQAHRPESSVAKGFIVDFSLAKEPLSVSPHSMGEELVEFCAGAGISDLSRLLTEGSYAMKDIGHPISMVAKSADAIARTVCLQCGDHTPIHILAGSVSNAAHGASRTMDAP